MSASTDILKILRAYPKIARIRSTRVHSWKLPPTTYELWVKDKMIRRVTPSNFLKLLESGAMERCGTKTKSGWYTQVFYKAKGLV